MGGGSIISHVGQIIFSTTLNTEDKVKEIYGGDKWEQIRGKFLFGVDDTHNVLSTGGEAQHTLTTNEMPSHNHSASGGGSSLGVGRQYVTNTHGFDVSVVSGVTLQQGSISIGLSGGGAAHNNMPPYLAVYIWLRKE